MIPARNKHKKKDSRKPRASGDDPARLGEAVTTVM